MEAPQNTNTNKNALASFFGEYPDIFAMVAAVYHDIDVWSDLMDTYLFVRSIHPNAKYFFPSYVIPKITILNTKNYHISDKFLQKCMSLWKLYVSNNETITSAGLASLPIRELILDNNYYVTNEGLKCLPFLRSLGLVRNEVIDDEGIKNLPILVQLNIAHNPLITDNGLEELICLEELNLNGNNMITDNGISHLPLKELILYENTGISNAMREKLLESSVIIVSEDLNSWGLRIEDDF